MAVDETGRTSTGGPEAHEDAARDRPGPILDVEAADELQQRWSSIQTSFVEDPQHALEEADALVREAIDRLRDTFAEERQSLQAEWGGGDDVSTEDMRIALQRYRSFFHRLLSTT
jgi:hypothetical protein